MDDGKTYQEITDWLGCSYRSVAYWCVHGDPDNLESLNDGRNQGNYRKATDEYINLLDEIYIALNKNFAYRVIDEITLYIQLNTELFGNEEFNKYFDEQIYQKILPKLHGSKAMLKPQLEKLKAVLSKKDENEYKYSLNKINEMLIDIQQGYASFNRR